MGKRILLPLILSVTFAFGVSYAVSDQHKHDSAHHGGQHSGGGSDHGKDYSLTAEQKVKLKELKLAFKAETAELKGAIFTKRLQLEALWMNPKSDPNAILEKAKEMAELKRQYSVKRAQFRVEARKVYTPEQLAYCPMKGWGDGHRHGTRMGRGMEGRHKMGPGMGSMCVMGGMGHGMKGGMGHGHGMTGGQGMGMEMCK